MINGTRVRQARELRGIAQSELANAIGVSQSTIAHLEAGRLQPSDALLEAIAFMTQFPLAFFRQQSDPPEFPDGSLLYRARTSLSASQRIQAQRHGQAALEMSEQLIRRFRLMPMRLPQVVDVNPEEAAKQTRSALGLSPDTPIKNLTRAVEKIGVLVLAVPFSHAELDAVSAWVGSNAQRPVIVTYGHNSGDRLRMSTAHEVGHLVMHVAPKGKSRQLEKEADQFAAALLLPEAAVRQELLPPLTLSSIASLKPRWGVSMQAIIMRAATLGIIGERQKRYLFEQIGARGWRKQEPIDISVERPRAARQMAELLYGIPVDFAQLAADVGLPASLLKQILDLYEGKGGSSPSPTRIDMDPNSSNIRFFGRKQG